MGLKRFPSLLFFYKTSMVLKLLEEVGTALPQSCTQTKLELIQQVNCCEGRRDTERVANEKQAQIDTNKILHLEEIERRDVGINHLKIIIWSSK